MKNCSFWENSKKRRIEVFVKFQKGGGGVPGGGV